MFCAVFSHVVQRTSFREGERKKGGERRESRYANDKANEVTIGRI